LLHATETSDNPRPDGPLGLYANLTFAFLDTELMFGVKIVVTGDRVPKGENAVIVMNHRCRLDWLFFWSVVARYGELKHEKIIMKHELKHIPGPGE